MPLDLHRLRSHPFLRHCEFHEELDSTNTRALALASEAEQASPLLILANKQTAGRGRGANRWWSAEGSLTFSILLNAHATELPPQYWPLVSLATALAVGETLRELAPGVEVALKWPNDVFLNGRKVCGILVETPPVQSGKLVVGVGLNINNSFATAPGELRATATALCDATGRGHDRTSVLCGLLSNFARDWPRVGQGTLDLAARWRPHCYLTGRTVHLLAGQRTTVGRCEGIDNNGSLLLATETGLVRCLAGVVAKIE